ncbi:unnamed protein product [Darwinula stevensoni]|uniref:Uncharacterized protein n=1 Tax=Darwinula stevensoni TaxID=69355 RepID=A0A7R9AK09_9CRUS|nr:unnamed protein product [Darwinula stevensoni]CAG0909000.1 unnamed protein product [Darwinula stevensoni]
MNLKTGLALLPFALWIQTVVAVTFKDLYRRDGEEMGFVDGWMPALQFVDSLVENLFQESPCESSEPEEGACRAKRDANDPDPIPDQSSEPDPAPVPDSGRKLDKGNKKSNPSPYVTYIYYSLPLFSLDLPLPFPPGQLTAFTSPGVKISD